MGKKRVELKMSLTNNSVKLLKEIYCDRRLLVDLSVKDVNKRFSGTYFGLVWGILQPLMTIVVYWFAFQFGFRSGDVGETPFVLWFISGMISWLYISESFANASSSLLEYNYLIQKVKFNVNILPLVKILSSFYIHLIFLVIALIICALLGYPPSLKLLQIGYYIFSEIAFVFSLSLLTSSIMVFFRDLGQIISIILLIGMWGTPIAWDLNVFAHHIQKILKLNPFYYLIEGYRDALLGRGWFWERPMLTIYFWIVTTAIFLMGANIFKKLRPHFADTV